MEHAIPANSPGNPSFRKNPEEPSCTDIAIAGLEYLSRKRNGFFLFVEQGDIDWANHANDFEWMVSSVVDLHNAVDATIKWVDRPGDDIDWSNTLLIVTADHANSFMRFGDKKLGKGELPEYIAFDPLETKKAYVNGEIKYYANYHTNELVSFYAKGDGADKVFGKYEGAWYPGTRLIDNTHIFRAIADYTGVKYEYRLKPVGPDGKPLAATAGLLALLLISGMIVHSRRR
ncbi:MAG: hypothetical protein Kow00107_05270 [Planctomycetota bacterium]